MTKLDRLLGKAAVIATPAGTLQINDAALGAQRHIPRPEPGLKCWCPACKSERDKKPETAPEPIKQPWELAA